MTKKQLSSAELKLKKLAKLAMTVFATKGNTYTKAEVYNKSEVYNKTEAYNKTETYSKAELNDMITTPNQQYVSVTATNQTTAATDVLPATGSADTIYRVGNWDGSQFDETVYSEYAWDGSAYVHLSTKTQIGEVFDISAYHATGGTLATYADLASALGTGGANVPADIRRGGMSVKFVRTSDNTYVQYRYMGTAVTGTPNPFLDTANWQGVDDVPTVGSNNLVKSGGVKADFTKIVSLKTTFFSGYLNDSSIIPSDTFEYCDYISVLGGSKLVFYNSINSIDSTVRLVWYKSDKNIHTAVNLSTLGIGEQTLTVPSDVYYVRISKRKNADFYAGIDFSPLIDSIKRNADDSYEYLNLGDIVNANRLSSGMKLNASGVMVAGDFYSGDPNFIRVRSGSKIYKKLYAFNNDIDLELAFYSDNNVSSFISGVRGTGSWNEGVVDVPQNAKYFRFATIGAAGNAYIKYNIDAEFIDVNAKIQALQTIVDSLQTPENIVVKDGTGISGKGIPTNLSVGGTFNDAAASSVSSVFIDSVLTAGAKGIFIICVQNTSTCKYVVVDENDTILAIGAAHSSSTNVEEAQYIDLEPYPTAYKVYYAMRYATNKSSIVYRDYDKSNIHIFDGVKTKGTFYKSDGTTEISGGFAKDELGDIKGISLTNDGTNNKIYIKFPITLCRTLGFCIRCKSSVDIAKISKIEFTYGGKQTATTTTYSDSFPGSKSEHNNMLFQHGEWVFVKTPLLANAHYGLYIDKIGIEVTFDSGSTSTDTISLQFREDVIINHFNRPIFMVNFDSAWAATETCGAYDLLLTNHIPFTITGKIGDAGELVSQSMLDKFNKAYGEGLLDIGKYGGENDGGYEVSANATYPTIIANINQSIQAKQAQGYDYCYSFGPGANVMNNKLLRALKTCGFKGIRIGSPQGSSAIDVPVCKEGIFIDTYSNDSYLLAGSIGVLFAHGISSNPSGETNPSMYIAYTLFSNSINSALTQAQKGGLVFYNFAQFNKELI